MINGPLKTLEYFCSSLLDPMFEMFDVDNPSHPEYAHLQEDLDAIDSVELEDFTTKHKIDHFLTSGGDRVRQRKVYLLIHNLQRAIAERKLQALMDSSGRPKPYDSINLRALEIDKNNLLSIRKLNSFGLIHNNYGYMMAPATAASNSSYWTTEALLKIAYDKHVDFKVRLDPFIEKPLDEYNPMMFRMRVYGQPLNWNRLRDLKTAEFGQWLNENESRDYFVTDYVWDPDEKEISFTCEELPNLADIAVRGSRYFHAIFDKISGEITHCDGAIRVYQAGEYETRLKYHVRHPTVRKIGRRVKLFQADNTHLDQEDFILLARSFFVWNDDLAQYFIH